MADIRDFYIIERLIEKQKDKCSELTNTTTFDNKSNVFYFVVLNLLFDLDLNSCDQCITDQLYLKSMGRQSGKGGGIDAIFIEQGNGNNIVHLFTFKHTQKLDAAMESISSSVIDKLLFYISILQEGNIDDIPNDYNPLIKSYTERIFNLITENTVNFVVHICGNFSSIEENEKQRLENQINKYPLFKIEYDFLDKLVNIYLNKEKKNICGKIVVTRGLYFAEKSNNNNCENLIAKVDALMLLKLLSVNNKLRNKTSYDISDFNNYSLEEAAFDDNVRMFLGDTSKINKSIISTAKSPTENKHFYYYNNGITILCSSCKEGISNKTTFTIDNIQIVNGSQTIHNLANICQTNPSILSNIFLLCRFYSVVNHNMHSHIAEYTNSQHQVKPRDIKALDSKQIKIEKEFELLGYKYDRKKNQNRGSKVPLAKRIDSEKCGKMLIAFYAEDPWTARNDTSSIFTSKYDIAFDDGFCAEKVLIVKKYFDYIEAQRKHKKSLFNSQTPKYYYNIMYSSYYYLFAMKKIFDKYIPNIGNTSVYPSDNASITSAYNIAYSLFTLVSEKKLKTSPNIDLSDYFKANSAKTDFITEFSQLNDSLNIQEAENKAKQLLDAEIS